MNEKQIRKLIRLVEESEIESLEVSSWWRKVKITQRAETNGNGHKASPAVLRPVANAAEPALSPASTVSTNAQSDADISSLVAIKSPMVGTFYTAPSPDADAYVSLNEKISEGQVVCIVEAMKLMNEIESEISGRVTRVLVENGKPVEFGQELFLIDPTE